jgi:hypothetical protein
MEKKISNLLTQMINGIAELNRSNQRLFRFAIGIAIASAGMIAFFSYKISTIFGR